MTKDEKRMIRREWISFYLRHGITSIFVITIWIRNMERREFGQELKVY